MKRNKKKCEKCNKEISLSNYKSHILSCGKYVPRFIVSDDWFIGDDRYKCPICFSIVHTKKGMVTHYYRKHTPDGRKFMQSHKLWEYAAQKPIWNKGLTKFNHKSLEKQSRSMKKYFETAAGTFIGKKHSRDSIQKMRESAIKYLHTKQTDPSLPFVPRIGKIEKEILDELESVLHKKIVRNQQVIGYFPDGYIHDLHLCIEIDEPYHENIIERDNQKNSDYTTNGYFCFRIKQEDWLKQKILVLENFLFYIAQISLK